MAHFFNLQDKMEGVVQEYFRMAQRASDEKPKEMAAVIKVQSVFRASQVRKSYFSVRGGTLLIQRVIRGSLARSTMKTMRLERAKRLNALFFHHCAMVIQRFFRGWSSRRNLHDYYGRKHYLATIGKRGEWTTQYLQQEHHVKNAAAKEDEEKAMRREFDTLAGELHHLVSTQSISGVYNPPYNDVLPAAFDKPIEQHLRDSCRAQLPKSMRRPRHRAAVASASPQRGASLGSTRPAAAGAVGTAGAQRETTARPQALRSASEGRVRRIQGPFRSKEQIEVANAKASSNYKSVQAAAGYNVVDQDRRMQERLSKLTRVSPVDFVAPGLPQERPTPSSVHTHVPFRERPVELRNDYVELPKIRDKPPFFTAVARDRHFTDYNDQPFTPSGLV